MLSAILLQDRGGEGQSKIDPLAVQDATFCQEFSRRGWRAMNASAIAASTYRRAEFWARFQACGPVRERGACVAYRFAPGTQRTSARPSSLAILAAQKNQSERRLRYLIAWGFTGSSEARSTASRSARRATVRAT